MKFRLRETIEYSCYATIVTGVSIIGWWPWRYFASNSIEYDRPAIAFIGLGLIAIAGLINLTLTMMFIRENQKLKNGINLVVGAFSLLLTVFIIFGGV